MGIQVEDFEDYDEEEEDSKTVVKSAKATATATFAKPSARTLPAPQKKPEVKDEDVIELLSDDDDEESSSNQTPTLQNTAPVSSTSYFANFLKTALSAVKPSSSAPTPSAASSTAAPSSTLLVYPATGRSRISVTHQDLASLDPGKELNDTIIDFYMRYIVQEIVDSSRRSRVHVFST